jgi:hypothetical protein
LPGPLGGADSPPAAGGSQAMVAGALAQHDPLHLEAG